MAEIIKYLSVAAFIALLIPIVLIKLVNALYGHFFEDFDE
jgi:hypothetical protein